MPSLDDVDSRRLFFKRIFRSDDPCPAELKEVSIRILKKCGGLPLAIITFASLLASRTHDKDEWERLQDSIGTGFSLENDGNLKEMNDILLLSYWDLPHYLKTCLLYLCIYPEDYKINCEELKLKWVAEGFLATQWGCLDQVAHNCFNDLVNRNMIQPLIEYDGSIEYCRVHDMVLDLIIYLSGEENFATVLNGRICNSFPSKMRRLSLHFSGNEHIGAVRAIAENKFQVRSLTTFQSVKQMPCLVDFHALRVLDLKGCDWLANKHVKNIGSSHQLRYLRIGSPKITELPVEIGRLQLLETLDLKKCFYLLRLPSTVVQLQKLVYLSVSLGTQLPLSEFGSLQALEALESLNIWKIENPMRFAEELGHLTNLRKLRIETSGKSLMDYATRERLTGIFVASVSKLGNLRSLAIADEEMGQCLFRDPCCTYPYLQDFTICSVMVPKGMASLSDLVKLCIFVSEFDNEGLHILMGMPSLVHLELDIHEPIKEKLTVCNNGFRLLKVFHYKYWFVPKVDAADGLCVTFAAGSVPALRQLLLLLCPMAGASNFIADLGVEHLPGPAHLQVQINCYEASSGRLKDMQSSIEKATLLHPKRKIHVIRVNEYSMYKDDNEWEEAVAKEREEREESREEDDESVEEE
ncbi:unnamed protein product [Alopecurus aequalis]